MRNKLSIILMLIVICFYPYQAWAFTQQQRFQIERTPAYDPTDCVTSSSTSPSQGVSISTPGSVVVIGDSIMDATKDTLARDINARGNGWSAEIDSHFSRPLKGSPSSPESDGITVINNKINDIKNARAVVIELGTNGSLNAADLQTAVTTIRNAPSSATIYWVNTAQVGRPEYQAIIDNANAVITAAAGPQNFKIIDWNKAVAAHPEYIKPISDPSSLGVHPTQAGVDALAQLITDSVTGTGGTGSTSQPGATTPNVPTVGEVTISGNNKGYDGGDVWSQAELQQVEANRPFYEKAAQKAGIDWRIIPPIHLNESGLGRVNPANGQGIYQDFARANGPYPPGPVSDEEFQRQTDWVATFIKAKADANPATLNNLNTPDGIKETYWGFNGKAEAYRAQAAALGYNPTSQGFEGSPYVMNKADAKRDPTKNTTSWGQIKRDNGPIEYPANNFYGAFIHYGALGGLGGGAAAAATGGCSGSATSSVVGTTAQKVVQIAEAEMFSGIAETTPGCNCGPGVEKYTVGQQIPWCAAFVSWVYKQAGAQFSGGGDPNSWLITYVPNLQDYLKNSGKFDYHEKGDNYVPQPGDIIIYLSNNASHTGLVEKVNGDVVTSLDGNWQDKVTSHEINYKTEPNLTGFGTLKVSQ